MIDFNDTQFELEEEQFLTNDTSITYANAWNFTPGYQLPQNFQCGGVDNVGMFLCVANDGYVRLTAVEPGTGVPQEYVDRQDQAVLEEATQRLEQGAEQLTQLINQEANTREQEDIRLSNLIDNLDATKAGTNYVQVSPTGSSTNEVSYITIGEEEYKIAGGGSGTPTHYLKTLNVSGNTMTFKKVVDGTEEDQSYTPNFDDKYVSLTDNQTITGVKNFATNLQFAGKTVATEEALLAEQETRGQSISILSDALTNERNNRVDADNDLQTNINACEKTANKVGTIEASDTNYPTCNAVIAYINSLNGDNDQF